MLFWKVSLYIKREKEVAETIIKYKTIQALKPGILNKNILPIKFKLTIKKKNIKIIYKYFLL